MDDVIVIGAGLAGLSAAMELTEKGLFVRIIEKEHFIGGRTAKARHTCSCLYGR